MHGLNTMAFLHDNQQAAQRQRAADPGNTQARTTALAIIPPGTRRYGMHYVLDANDPVHQAIVESILEA